MIWASSLPYEHKLTILGRSGCAACCRLPRYCEVRIEFRGAGNGTRGWQERQTPVGNED